MMVKAIRKNKKKTGSLIKTVIDSTDLQSMLGKAVGFHQTGNLSKAESLYREILLIDPEHADALHLLGVTSHQAGENSTAIEYIKKAIAINPSMPNYHNNLGNAFLNSEKTDEAVMCFEEALILKPDYVEACNNLGNALKKRGEDRRALDCYLKATKINPAYIPAINNLANLLKEQGRLDEAITNYKKAVILNPESASTYFNLGNAYSDADRFDDAVEHYYKAISINTDFAEAYCNLGNIFKKINKYDEAIDNYRKTISLKPDFAEAFNNLSDTYRVLGKFSEAVELCRKAIQVKPDFVYAYVNLGNIYYDHGDYSLSIEQYQRAIEIRPDYEDAHYNKSLVLLLTGEFDEGWREYEWRFKTREITLAIGYQDTGLPVWDGSCLKDKTILIQSEQGAGDSIQFARFIPMVRSRCKKVIFECDKKLVRLFEGHDGIDAIVEKPYRKDDIEVPDLSVHEMSLPGIFNINLSTIASDVPYIKAGPEIVSKWKSIICSDQFKVGIVWAGNPNHTNDGNRSCKLSDFDPLINIQGVDYFSLQKGNLSEQINNSSKRMNITDLGHRLNDFSDTAAAIMNLDLVISVDTAVVHLAGALGKTVWTLLPYSPDWRWMLDRDDSPWYPTMSLFRQSEAGDWQGVFERVSGKLMGIIKDVMVTTEYNDNKMSRR